MADKLGVYNGVMDLLGEPMLASLSTNSSARRKVDAVYTKIVKKCLASYPWNFASRTVRLDNDPDLATEFGHQYVFQRPDNFARLVGISLDESMTQALTRYVEERSFWYCDFDVIYVRFVDDSTDYGFDLSLWTPHFQLYVEAELAAECAQSIRESKVEYCTKLAIKRKRDAETQDAIGQPPEPKPIGSWRRQRYSRGVNRFSDNRA
jgi:hypothetical protein